MSINQVDLINQIFAIQNEDHFNDIALRVYQHQKNTIPVYREFVNQLKRKEPQHYSEIPFLPISFFKSHQIIAPESPIEVQFQSSGTTGSTRSKHFVADASIYKKSFTKAYTRLIGKPSNQVILALLPNYLEQGYSSLVYMVDELIKQTNSYLSGFLLNEPEQIEIRYKEALASGKEIVLFGVSYALLDLASKKIDLSQALIIETGGMKGRRKELSKEELHQALKNGLNVSYIASEYGMTELLSQGYSKANGLFQIPNWMKICLRDVNDPFSVVHPPKTGAINVIDLANIYSCSFIATDDLGRQTENGFQLMGRIDLSDIRGCNMLIQ